MNDAFFFDDHSPDAAQLFGTCTLQDKSRAADVGVLFCHAFSEERQKSYRSTFLFAQTLAYAGIPSFRFDYKGTGDSQGNLSETTIDSMVEDTVGAYEEAKQRLGVDKLVVLGIRLGAVIAVKASPRLRGLEKIILWNPIIEGKRYYRDLTRTEAIINLARKKSADVNDVSDSGFVEIDAELVSPEMVDQLKNINLVSDDHSIAQYFITGRKNDKIEMRQIDRLAQHLDNSPTDATCWTEETGDFWSSRSMYDAFYPTNTFEATLRWLNQ